MSNEVKNPESKANVVDLASFRRKKDTDTELARGRQPLYVSHLTGRVSTTEESGSKTEAPDFGDRLQRIRSSLDKINRLMTELKRMSAGEGENAEKRQDTKTDLRR